MPTARTAISVLLTAAAVALPAAASAAATGSPEVTATAKKQLLSAKLEACATDASGSYATFTGTMPNVRADASMEMRFDLFQQRRKFGRWTRVAHVPSLGAWDSSDPGVSGFIVKKRVGALVPGTAYRATVRYRWRNDADKVFKVAKKLTATCTPKDTRPDLVVRDATATLLPSGKVAYRFAVRNTGGGPAGPFAVVVEINGAAQPAQAVAGLVAGQDAPLTFQAPACTPGSTIRITADPAGAVVERNEANNVLQRACPNKLSR